MLKEASLYGTGSHCVAKGRGVPSVSERGTECVWISISKGDDNVGGGGRGDWYGDGVMKSIGVVKLIDFAVMHKQTG